MPERRVGRLVALKKTLLLESAQARNVQRRGEIQHAMIENEECSLRDLDTSLSGKMPGLNGPPWWHGGAFSWQGDERAAAGRAPFGSDEVLRELEERWPGS